jgi:peptide/nickel transport system substrate-binding protein
MPTRLLVALLSAVLLAACTGDAAPPADLARGGVDATAGVADSEPAPRPPLEGGTVRVGMRTEPEGLNPWAAPASAAVALVTRPVLAPLWRLGPDGGAEPWLLAGEPEVRGGDGDEPLTVVYQIRDGAVWSDGQPIDGRDLLFTLAACAQLPTGERAGEPCAAVDLAASSATGAQATVVFARPDAGWRSLLTTLPVLPEHVLAGRDVRTAWHRRLPVSSGPFRFASWTPGERIVLVRNERWWGDRPPLDRLEFLVDETMAIPRLLDDTIDVVAVDATVANLERARAAGSLRVAVAEGRAWEALDFNLASPRVARAAVRRALAAELDAAVLLDELVRPITPAIRPHAGLLAADGTGVVPSAEPTTRVAWADLGCDPGDDGVLVCDGDRMRLRLTFADGSWRHRLVGEYVADQLADAGVEVVTDGGDDGLWDLRVTTVPPTTAASMGDRWRCDGMGNTQAYCNPALDDLLDRAAGTLDEAGRDAVLAEAAQVLSDDRPTQQLFAVPQMLAYRAAVRGPAVNDGPWGLTWNTETWARTTRGGN